MWNLKYIEWNAACVGPRRKEEKNFACLTERWWLQQNREIGVGLTKNVLILQEGKWKYAEKSQEDTIVQKMGYTIDYIYAKLTSIKESERLVTSEMVMGPDKGTLFFLRLWLDFQSEKTLTEMCIVFCF